MGKNRDECLSGKLLTVVQEVVGANRPSSWLLVFLFLCAFSNEMSSEAKPRVFSPCSRFAVSVLNTVISRPADIC